MILIQNATVITPSSVFERGWLLTDGIKIAAMGPGTPPEFPDAQVIEARGYTLLPGFIDIHVHGAVGHEFMDASPDGLREAARFYAQSGVTGFLPTTWTDKHERIQTALEMIAELQGPQPDGATVLGAHLEGPYLNPEKCGAQNQEYIRQADANEALGYLALDTIRLVALAPEYEANLWLLQECVRRGITVSAAHTDATYLQIQFAVGLGLSHVTHTYNAMRGLHHREPGTLGAALTLPELTCEVVADNIHVHPAAIQLLVTAKGLDKVALVTDAMRGAGMPDGEYEIDRRTVMVEYGAVRLPDGTLAGSTLTMNRALRNLMKASGKSLVEAWPTASLVPARAIHLGHRKGSLEIGKDADLVLVDDDLNVYLTIAEGRVVYAAH